MYHWNYIFDSNLSVAAIIAIAVICIGASAGLAFIPANMAKKKGYSFAGFYCLSFFVSFVIAIIIAAVLEDKYPRPLYPPYAPPYPYPPYVPSQPLVRCPGCGAAIPAADAFCSKCGAQVK